LKHGLQWPKNQEHCGQNGPGPKDLCDKFVKQCKAMNTWNRAGSYSKENIFGQPAWAPWVRGPPCMAGSAGAVVTPLIRLTRVFIRNSCFSVCKPCRIFRPINHIASNIHRVRKKRGHVIFNYNSRLPWSIFIIFIPLETGMNTPQLHVIYLLKIFMTS